jgi:hypothetical protein
MTLEKYRQLIRQHCQPRHPELYTLTPDIFAPTFRAAIRQGSAKALQTILKREHPDVYSFEMLRPEFCSRLIEDLDWFEDCCMRHRFHKNVPNTMSNYGAVLDDFGFGPFLQELMLEWIAPLAGMLYPDAGGASLDEHDGFVVEYTPGKDTALDFHVDMSEVTLNVCLGEEFTWGQLYFGGIRCALHQTTVPRPEEEFELIDRRGQALLHRGKHRHAAKSITGGRRLNLILWCMSSFYHRSDDPSQCQRWCRW